MAPDVVFEHIASRYMEHGNFQSFYLLIDFFHNSASFFNELFMPVVFYAVHILSNVTFDRESSWSSNDHFPGLINGWVTVDNQPSVTFPLQELSGLVAIRQLSIHGNFLLENFFRLPALADATHPLGRGVFNEIE